MLQAVTPRTPPMPRVTIQDVAALAGLSTCTVSRALRNLPNVSAEAHTKVAAAAAELGYKASSAASRLAGGSTGSVAIIAPSATDWFFANAVEAAEEQFADHGLDTVLISLRNRPSVHRKVFGDPAGLAQRVDGVLLLNIALTAAEITALADSGLAIASVGMHGVPWDNVGIDNEAAAHNAASHLLDLGHARLAMLSGSETGEASVLTAGERKRGYIRALEERGAAFDPELVIEAGSGLEGGRRAMNELIRRGTLPSAVLAGCDETAFGALMALRECGLSAPEDISVAGIDDHQMSWFAGLTTVAQPVADQGAFAANLLAQRLLQPEMTRLSSQYALDTKLIERQSSRSPI